MKKVVLAGIVFYRRFVSPYKGFSCAHCAYTGGATCSAYGHRVIARYGVFTGLQLLRRRLQRCGDIYRQHIQATGSPSITSLHRKTQAGFCDVGCDVGACDAGDVGSGVCDVLDCGSSIGDCGGGEGKRRNKGQEKYVAIRPNSMNRSTRRAMEKQ